MTKQRASLLCSVFSLLFFSAPQTYSQAYDKTHVVHAIGNSHIDTAWLWTKQETINEIIPDTYHRALGMMNKYDDYRFSVPDMIHYKWAKKYYPDIYQKIKDRVAQGKWEIVGGQTLEPDTNISGGESQVRQFLYGKRFFKKEFGLDIRMGFLPDCFGFTWNWPQIMKKSGIDMWVTSKLTWNDTNQFLRGPFIWKGADGTEIPSYNLTHNYTGNTAVSTLRGTLDSVSSYGLTESLHAYGSGDHGGGPTSSDLDGLKKANKGSEFTTIMGTVSDYYNKYLVNHLDKLRTIEDELYLETHRGVYTSQASTKWGNRMSEIRAEEAEKFSSVFEWMGGTYPYEHITEIWEEVITTNQMHDILPGSSIAEVYKGPDVDGGTDAQYAKAIKDLTRYRNQALKNLANNLDTTGRGVPIVVTNSLSFARKGVVETEVKFSSPAQGVKIYDDGREIPSQVLSTDGNTVKFLFIAEGVPATGSKVFHVRNIPQGDYKTGLSIGNNVMENKYFKVTLSPKTGHITSLYDKENGKEAFKADANELHFFKDEPLHFDAWNLGSDVKNDVFTVIKTVDGIDLVESGPIRATYRVRKSHSNSDFTQLITLYSEIDRVDVKMATNWNEDRKLLKVSFPINVSGKSPSEGGDPLATKWCARNSEPHWLNVDLGQLYKVDGFSLAHAQAGGEQSGYNTRGYKVQSSLDGTKWTDLVVETNNSRPMSVHAIRPIDTRYVRLYITDAEQGSGTDARIYDFQVLSSGTNVAANKSVTADGSCNANEAPELAVDAPNKGTPSPSDTVATYEIPYAAIQRSIKRKSSYEKARFEHSGHKWADMSEKAANYGVSILNDSKYGWDALDNRLRLTLLKSAIYPDANADDGFHEFTYSIYPHSGDWAEANTVQKGYELNYPLIPLLADSHTGTLGKSWSFAQSNQDNIIISAIKRSEDDPNAYIMRLYEAEGRAKTKVKITLPRSIASVHEMDMIEWENIGSIAFEKNQFSLQMGKFDIRTIRFELEAPRKIKPPLKFEETKK